MNLLNALRKSILLIGILLMAVFITVLFTIMLRSSSNDIKIILTYAAFLISAVLFIAVTVKFKIPQRGIYLGLIVLSFSYQIILSSRVFFIGEGDLQFYFSNAVKIATNNFTSPNLYGATFPGTVTYPAVLAFLMKLFGISRTTPVLLNHVVICALVCTVYSFLKHRIPDAWALTGAFLAALHPFTIIYSNTCNAELIFGAFILFSFFAFEKFEKAEEIRTKYLWIVLTALLCGISTLFRPLAIIIIIAYTMYIMLALNGKWCNKLLFSLVLIVVFSLFGFVNNAIIKSLTSYDSPSSSYGWNLYVGASPSGGWNEADGKEFSELTEAASSPSEIQSYFAAKAFERYKNMGFGIFRHGLNKLDSWLSYGYVAGQAARHDDDVSFVTKDSNGIILALTALVDIPILFLALAACVWILLKSHINSKSPDSLLILVLYLIGSFIVLMILETAPRYTVSYRILFCVLAVCLLESVSTGIRKSAKKTV